MSFAKHISWQQLRQRKDWQGYLLSAVFTLALVLHLLMSDVVIAGKQIASDVPAHRAAQTLSIPVVDVLPTEPVLIQQELQLYGRTEANRSAHIRAELAGPVASIHLQEGDAVAAGDVVVDLQTNDLPAKLSHARALVTQRELEFASSQRLQQQGFQAKISHAVKATQLAEARAQLASLENAIADSHIQAPFDGVLNKTLVEQGDFLKVGDAVAEVLELDPLVVKVFVPETAVTRLYQGQQADVSLLNGDNYRATVRYIAADSAPGTNTFAVELRLPNPAFKIPAGVSTKVTLYTEQLSATVVSPAYLTLNEQGQTGVFVVQGKQARFKPANIIKSDASQLWIESLGEHAQVIVAGHQSVIDGGEVEVRTEQSMTNRAIKL